MEEELPTLPQHTSSSPDFSGVRVTRSLVFCVMFCRSLFVLFPLAIELSVLLRFTDSDYLPLVSSNSCKLSILNRRNLLFQFWAYSNKTFEFLFCSRIKKIANQNAISYKCRIRIGCLWEYGHENGTLKFYFYDRKTFFS